MKYGQTFKAGCHGLIYHNPCWTLEFAASRNVGDNSFYLLFSLAGIGTPIDFGLPEF
jgi:hypothetical protein